MAWRLAGTIVHSRHGDVKQVGTVRQAGRVNGAGPCGFHHVLSPAPVRPRRSALGFGTCSWDLRLAGAGSGSTNQGQRARRDDDSWGVLHAVVQCARFVNGTAGDGAGSAAASRRCGWRAWTGPWAASEVVEGLEG